MMSNICLSASGGDPTLGMIVVYGIIGQILIFLVLAVLIGIIYLVRLVFLMIVGKKEDAAEPFWGGKKACSGMKRAKYSGGK